MPDAIEIGRVVGAHGLRGQLRVRYVTDGPDALLGLERVTLTADKADATGVPYEVSRVTAGRPGEVRVALDGVRRREDAEALLGARVLIDAAQLAPLAEGEYYAYQLVGCRLETSDGEAVGTVCRLWSTGAPDVMVVACADGTERMVPAARDWIREVDLEARRIVMDLPPGLLEDA